MEVNIWTSRCSYNRIGSLQNCTPATAHAHHQCPSPIQVHPAGHTRSSLGHSASRPSPPRAACSPRQHCDSPDDEPAAQPGTRSWVPPYQCEPRHRPCALGGCHPTTRAQDHAQACISREAARDGRGCEPTAGRLFVHLHWCCRRYPWLAAVANATADLLRFPMTDSREISAEKAVLRSWSATLWTHYCLFSTDQVYAANPVWPPSPDCGTEGWRHTRKPVTSTTNSSGSLMWEAMDGACQEAETTEEVSAYRGRDCFAQVLGFREGAMEGTWFVMAGS